MDKRLVISPNPHAVCEGYVTRSCNITRLDGDVVVDEMDLWFELSADLVMPEEDDCEAYLLALLMEAMREGRDIYLGGGVSKKLIRNLMEYQCAWNKWVPQSYSVVDITASCVTNGESRRGGAVCAYTGGLDSTFSVWKHMSGKNVKVALDIKFCSFVHGFDVPLEDTAAYERALRSSALTLDSVGLSVYPVVTNLKNVMKSNWAHSHGCAIVAALSNFKAHVGTCIIGSTRPYESLFVPWGSSPITDHLLSAADFDVVHDGASFSRPEKIEEILDWEAGVNNLRVCWEGELKDRNCGICEKCIKTKLSFLAVGSVIPPCFPDSENLVAEIEATTIKNDLVRQTFLEVYENARRHNVSAPWVDALYAVAGKRANI